MTKELLGIGGMPNALQTCLCIWFPLIGLVLPSSSLT